MHGLSTQLTVPNESYCTVLKCEFCLDAISRLQILIRDIDPITEKVIEVRTFYCDECHGCTIIKLNV